ncbi:MAG TPA: flagellar basal body protein [Burkholderiaceae bacterium]
MNIDAVSLEMVRSALDIASLRQQVIATNIANASTAGYVRKTLSFGDQVDALSEALGLRMGSSATEGVRVVADTGVDGVGRTVQLDEEVADMAQNGVNYQALLRAASKHYSILLSAATEGHR